MSAAESGRGECAPGGSGRGESRRRDDETEADVRFTYANESTFLAWNRTALALAVAGLAIPAVAALPRRAGGRHMLGVPLIVLGAVLPVASYVEWSRNQHAMRRGGPLPPHTPPPDPD